MFYDSVYFLYIKTKGGGVEKEDKKDKEELWIVE